MRASFLSALVAAALLMSCTTGTDGDGDGYDTTTVLGTLNLFVDVWNSCDIDTYKVLLDEDTFTFYFDPRDVQDRGLPTFWEYDDEIEAVGNLFDAVGAENVDVTLDLSEVTEPEEEEETYRVNGIPYEVRVYVEEEDIIYLAQERLDMELTWGDGAWVITKWWDKVSRRLPGSCTTWGAIKAAF